MYIGSNFRMAPVLLASLLAASFPAMAVAGAGAGVIASRTAEVEGIKLHYLTAGHSPAVILLHGHTQTSRMWGPLIPQLAEKFTVIAPDLPGIGDSDIPKASFAQGRETGWRATAPGLRGPALCRGGTARVGD
jgi:hypothetical protein